MADTNSSLHIAISTGQNVANFIPIREMGQKGDEVLLIESDTARQRHYTAPLAQLLQEHGFSVLDPLNVSDQELVEVYPLSHKLEARLCEMNVSERPKFFYFNGGQKMAALGMYEVANPLNATLVYLDYPAIRLIVTDRRKRISRLLPIGKDIQLPDLLSLHNTRISENTERITRDEIGQYKPDLTTEKFYRDAELVRGIQKTMRFAQNNEASREKFNILQEFKSFCQQDFEKQLQHHLDKVFVSSPLKKFIDPQKDPKLYQKVINFLTDIGKYSFKKYPQLLEQYQQNKITIALTESEKQKLVEIGWLNASADAQAITIDDVRQRLGPFFEKVVLNRFLLFLKNHPSILELISEVWTNIKFEAIENPGKTTGEYDILILLKSSVLISLECKSYRFQEKELFARIARLVRRSGLLNEQWASLMMFTDETLVQEENVSTYMNLQKLGVPLIPFGLSGQPESLMTDKMETPIEVPAFEAALQQSFAKYLPIK